MEAEESNAGTRRTEAGGPATAEQLGPDYDTSYDPGQQRAADRPQEVTPPPQETNPITSVDPYTGEVTFSDGQVLVDPSQEEIATVSGRPDVPTGSLPASRGRNEPRSQAGGGRPDVPVGSLPAGEKPKMNPVEKDYAGAALAQQKIAEATQAEPPNPDLNEKTPETVLNDGQAVLDNNPKAANKIKGQIKEAFGDLIDTKELARMAVMFLGARATGASPGQALAFAGQNYIARIDAKHGAYERAAISGKYSKASLAAYKESHDPADLVALGAAPQALGNFQTFYKDGKEYRAEEYDINGSKVWMSGNTQINSSFTDDASTVAGTKEYDERINKEAKAYTDQVAALQDRFFTDEDGKHSTDIESNTAGRTIAKFAIAAGIPPQGMGSLVRNALEAATRDARNGVKVSSLEPYLNEQYVVSQVGDNELFKNREGKAVSAVKMNELFSLIGNTLRREQPEQYGDASNTAISSDILQEYRNDWPNMDPEVRKSYIRRAGPGESGFMVFLRDQLSAQ